MTARPFLKWAGGKTGLLPELRKHVPEKFGCYHEPFVGGGALFFDILPEAALLNDVNPHLVAAYRGVRDRVDDVVRLLQSHATDHSKGHYLRVRQQLSLDDAFDVQTAARVIYLNKTCFNGLWRVNQSGKFNVPMGDYTNPLICDETTLRACAEALSHADLNVQDWQKTASWAEAGDFVYFDPPYCLKSTLAGRASALRVEGESVGPVKLRCRAERHHRDLARTIRLYNDALSGHTHWRVHAIAERAGVEHVDGQWLQKQRTSVDVDRLDHRSSEPSSQPARVYPSRVPAEEPRPRDGQPSITRSLQQPRHRRT